MACKHVLLGAPCYYSLSTLILPYVKILKCRVFGIISVIRHYILISLSKLLNCSVVNPGTHV